MKVKRAVGNETVFRGPCPGSCGKIITLVDGYEQLCRDCAEGDLVKGKEEGKPCAGLCVA